MNKLGRKLSISISIAVIVIFSISIFLTQYFLPNYYLHKTKEKVEDVSDKIEGMDKATFIDSIESIENKYGITIVYEPIHSNVDELNETIRNQLAKKRITLNKFWITKEALQRLEKGNTVNKLYDQGKLKSSFLASFMQKEDILVLVGVSIAHFSDTANIVNEFNLYMLGFSVIIIVMLVWLMSTKITTPLKELKDVSKDISNLKFETVHIKTNDEIEELADSINVMSDKLNKAHLNLKQKNENLKIVTSDLTHELKTPLSLIKAYCVGIKDGLDDGTYIDTIIKQTDNMSNVIEDLLNFSKIERDEIERIPINLFELVHKCLLKHKIEIETKEIKVRIYNSHLQQLFVLADEEKIEMVFNNLISNAIKYTEDDRIDIEFEDFENEIVFKIRNGTNIQQTEMIDQIWEPFYVLEESRNKKTSGTGLGLAIVHSILNRHLFNHGVSILNNQIQFYICFQKNPFNH
ncbi:sensor histidine kinase [Pseudalkalibacillus decolorationis]|uniref:sensor histidine kinase n=1 Tax=Pseudalkalibacillus decolorationis TaxID=163879 RepID=UPI0021481531|nr:HAMP domain-containing sensor histidine kinase [Pseudalkalibacillus decolorationis]